MKLESKLALFNALSKVIIFLIFVLAMPRIISALATANTDMRLREKKERVLQIITEAGIDTFFDQDQDNTFGSYNILKEEFISLELLGDVSTQPDIIENTQRLVDGEIVDYRVLSYTFQSGDDEYLLEIGRSTATTAETGLILRKFAIIFLLVVLVITIITDLAFSKYILEPLNTIIQTKLKNVHSPSNFNPKRITTTTTDFRYLDESINEMMHKIEETFQKEREFIGNVSHELQTPVSILQGRLENLLGDGQLNEHQSIKIADALKTLQRLKNTIKALLLISRIESDQFIKEDHISLKDLLDEILEEANERAELKNISIESTLLQDYILYHGNRPLLFTMIYNLISNAIKYNHENGKVYLKGYLDTDQYYKLEIIDTGIGISQEHLPNIFKRFSRFSNNGTEGHGLGLPIVRTIARFHGVDVLVDSKYMEGSTFTLKFPKTT
jgi:signal transduction histidine kinase